MCGIVGYIGPRDALPIIIGGLEKLEYRGYDSAGVALIQNGNLDVYRAEGKLANLKDVLSTKSRPYEAHLGLGHTRWATHGKPSERNAHPHSAGRVSIIHNGIIENYISLRDELLATGATFQSETDSEIAAHLFNQELERHESPRVAFEAMCKRLKGSYALVAIDTKHTDRIFVAKTATPIVIGVGEGETIVASDVPAVLEHTKQVLILDDGDIAEVFADRLFIINGGKEVSRQVRTITWDPVTAQKGGFKHYMLKEIHDQVNAVADTLRGRIADGGDGVEFADFGLSREDIRNIKRISLVACGTAWHACLLAKFFFEELAKIPCDVDYASEFRYRAPPLDKQTAVMAISQSGETADTVAAISLAGSTSPTFAICNVVGSSLTRKVNGTLYTQAGPEISVASTKAFSTQIVAAYLLALKFGIERGVVSNEKAKKLLGDLLLVPDAVSKTLQALNDVEKVATAIYRSRDLLYLGRGLCYPIALEGALKLKEISYIHAEGYPAGEIKHGPIALINQDMPVVVLLPRAEEIFDKTLSNLREVESRGAMIIGVTDTKSHKELPKLCGALIEVPYVSDHWSPLLMNIPLQLLAYHTAVLNGTDVDLPRNLAKSVTVE